MRKSEEEKMNLYRQNKKKEEKAILEIVKSYKIILCNLIKSGKNLNNEGMLFDTSSTYSKLWKRSSAELLSPEEREIYRINFSLASLEKKEAEIIWNEFFFAEDKFYWMKKYNRSTYYRLRAKAINNFYTLIK